MQIGTDYATCDGGVERIKDVIQKATSQYALEARRRTAELARNIQYQAQVLSNIERGIKHIKVMA